MQSKNVLRRCQEAESLRASTSPVRAGYSLRDLNELEGSEELLCTWVTGDPLRGR